MARNFDWRTPRNPESPLLDRWLYRYADTQCVGGPVWMRLVEALAPHLQRDGEVPPASPVPGQEQCLAACLNALRALRKRRRPRRLYIAYHQADILEARRLAMLANTLGMSYWLDAFDGLRLEPGFQQHPLSGTLTAASIEMGLVNCSHAVVVARTPSSGICWGAYQVARAREHVRLAGRHAIWLDERDNGLEFAGLSETLRGERALWRWLHGLPPLSAVAGQADAAADRRQPPRPLRSVRPMPGLREGVALGQPMLR